MDSVLAIRKGLTESENGPNVEDAPVAVYANGGAVADKLAGMLGNGAEVSNGC